MKTLTGSVCALSSWAKPADTLININNAVDYVNSLNGKVITLTGFEKNNTLSGKGKINFWLDAKSYGIVECYHQTILHIILDELNANK